VSAECSIHGTDLYFDGTCEACDHDKTRKINSDLLAALKAVWADEQCARALNCNPLETQVAQAIAKAEAKS